MTKSIQYFLVIAVFSNILFAQGDDFDSKYYNETIYLQQGFLGPKYMMGGNSYSVVSIGGELNRYPDSAELYSKYKFMRIVSLGLIFAGPLASVAIMGPGGGEGPNEATMSIYLGS